MTTNNFENKATTQTKTRSAVVFIDKYTTAGLSEIKAMCKENDLNDSCIIYNCTLHDTRPYRDIIKYITDQESPPAVIIDSNTCLYPQCIVSSSVLGTLEEMNLAEIYTYDQQLRTEEKSQKLHLIKQPTFDLLTNATWQLKAVEAMCEEKQKREKIKRGE